MVRKLALRCDPDGGRDVERGHRDPRRAHGRPGWVGTHEVGRVLLGLYARAGPDTGQVISYGLLEIANIDIVLDIEEVAVR